MCANSSADRKTDRKQKEKKCVGCQVSVFRRNMSLVTCHVSYVTCHVSHVIILIKKKKKKIEEEKLFFGSFELILL